MRRREPCSPREHQGAEGRDDGNDHEAQRHNDELCQPGGIQGKRNFGEEERRSEERDVELVDLGLCALIDDAPSREDVTDRGEDDDLEDGGGGDLDEAILAVLDVLGCGKKKGVPHGGGGRRCSAAVGATLSYADPLVC